MKRFRSEVNIARTRSFPWADIGSDHDLLMMTFRLLLKKISKPKHTRLKFDLEKLKDPSVLETLQAMIGGKFAPLTIMSNKNTDIDLMITTFNTAVTETASEILGKHHHHQSFNHEGRLGITDNFATNFLHFPLFSTAILDLMNSRPVHSLMLSPHLFLCLPCLLPHFTVPFKMFWPDLSNGRHDHTTAVCVSLRWSRGLHVVRLPNGSWFGLPHWWHGLVGRANHT